MVKRAKDGRVKTAGRRTARRTVIGKTAGRTMRRSARVSKTASRGAMGGKAGKSGARANHGLRAAARIASLPAARSLAARRSPTRAARRAARRAGRAAGRTGGRELPAQSRAQPPKAQRPLGIGVRKSKPGAPAGKATARNLAQAPMTLAKPRQTQSNLTRDEPNAGFAPQSGPRMPEVGEMAPEFELPDQNGDLVRLSEFRGRKVVLYFYPKDDSPGCTIEAQGFRDDHDLLQERGIVVLGVSKDDAASHKAFASKYDLNFRLLSDTTGETIQNYGCWVEKNLYGIIRMGVQRATFLIGEDGRIRKVWPKVTPEGHSKEILAML